MPTLYGKLPKKVRNGEKIIVKVQAPLFTQGSRTELMIYDETQNWNLMQEVEAKDMKEIFTNPDYPKEYWYAHFTKEGYLSLDEVAEEQEF